MNRHFADGPRDSGFDALWEIEGPGTVRPIVVEARSRFTPRSLDQLDKHFSPAMLRQLQDPIVLVVAPWFSDRSRDLIAERGWSYLDLTGNVLLRSRSPAIYVRLTGAATDPQPRPRNEVLLRGTGINALIRMLVDVEPPYRLSELAGATKLSMSYVSRALKTLHDHGLIEREGSGPVVRVRWPELLRQRASEYDLLRSNRSSAYLARSGSGALLRKLSGNADVTVTGSFAASRINQVAAPVQLVLYVPDIRAFAGEHGLLPARAGANVVLLEPGSASQLDRRRLVDGVHHAGYSQLAQDLLAGNGRLPEEGEALLDWMIDTPKWRLLHLPGE